MHPWCAGVADGGDKGVFETTGTWVHHGADEGVVADFQQRQ